MVEAALRNIFHEQIDIAEEIEPNLFRIVFEKLNNGIEAAFALPDLTHPDIEFIYQLKNNAAVFSAFKTHKLQSEIFEQLFDENGELKSFANFKADAQPFVEKDHKHLETEYDTGVLRARNAAKWKEFERDADLFPNLKWLPSTSVEKRESHKLFYNMVLPITHKFWREHYPGDEWNCKCGITNTNEKAWEKIPAIDDGIKPEAGLDSNPGLTGKLFTKTHPYFTKNKKTAKAATKIATQAIKDDRANKELKK